MDRQYNLRLDLQFRCNNSLMKFRQSDNKTSDFFMRITRGGDLFNIEKAIVILAVVKPNQSVQSQFLDITDGKIYADLNNNMKDQPGKYKAQALLIYQDERVATDIIEYEVTEDNILNQLETTVKTTEEFLTLQEMISRLSTIELQEQSRIDEELSRGEAEKLRNQSIDKIKAEIVKLVEDTNTKISNSLKSNTDKVNTLVADTKKELSDYKTTKDTELEEKFTEYKNETSTNLNNDFNTYKEEKDNAINQDLTNYKTEKNNEIDLYKSNKDTEIDKYVKDKNTELDAYKVAKNKEIDTYKDNKDTLINNKIIEVEASKQNMVSAVNNKVEEIDGKISETDTRLDELKEFDRKMQVVDSNENTRKSNEEARKLAESNRSNEHLAKISESNSKIAEINATKNEVIKKTDEKAQEIECRFSKLSTQQQQDAEVIEARGDSESLKEELERIETKAKEVWQSVEGSYITVLDSIAGSITDIEILGNTVQGSDLSNIQSAGIVQEDGKVKLSILSCGKNLFNINGEINQNPKESNVSRLPNTIVDNKIKVVRWSNNLFSLGQLIKVKPNTRLYISCEFESYVEDMHLALFVQDKNGETLKRTNTVNSPAKTYFDVGDRDEVIISFSRSGLGTENGYILIDKLIVSYEDSQYEPYQESRCDILLPCQLEGLEVKDRLYYSEEDKAWCVDKNVVRFSSDLNVLAEYNSPIYNPNGYICVKCNYPLNSVPFSQGKPFNLCKGLEGDTLGNLNNSPRKAFACYQDGNVGSKAIFISLPMSEVGDTFVRNTIQNYVRSTFEFYIATEPQKYILPLDTQIALNSFANQTNAWVNSGEVSGIFKGKVSKSLASSLQSAQSEIEKIMNKVVHIEGLQESQNFEYKTSTGYQICTDTKNGQIEKLKLVGKTLNNMMPNSMRWSLNADKSIAYYNLTNVDSSNLIKSNSKITIILLNTPTNYHRMMPYNYYDTTARVGTINVFEKQSALASNVLVHIYPNTGTSFTQEEVDKIKILILPGDQTAIAPYLGYFEGMKSVGDGADKLEVLSSNRNLAEVTTTKVRYKYQANFNMLDDGGIEIYPTSTSGVTYIRIGGYKLKKGRKYKFLPNRSGDYQQSVIWSGEGTTTDFTEVRLTNTMERDTIIDIGLYVTNTSLTNKAIVYPQLIDITDNTNEDYQPHKQHKKQILYYDPVADSWKKPILREWDSIEEKEGKTYYHRRSEQVILDGTSNYTDVTISDELSGTSKYMVFKDTKLISNSILSDKFLVIDDITIFKKYDGECCFVNHYGLSFKVLKSSLDTQDVDGFKAWLQTNNVTVVYQLAQEQIYECTPLTLDSYANETMIQFVGGSINPYMEFEITSHASNMILGLRKRVNYLEDKLIEYTTTQNRLQLKSMYSADRVTFRVDTTVLSTTRSKQDIDYDVFNLLKDNIEIGIDNYNRLEVEEMMDFYVSIGKLDYNMWDELWIIMELQHNPPVQEETPEIV